MDEGLRFGAERFAAGAAAATGSLIQPCTTIANLSRRVVCLHEIIDNKIKALIRKHFL